MRPRDTLAQRIARSQTASDVLFGRAMWRTSRVGAGTDALDPAAVRVGVLFLGFRGPRPREKLGFIAPRFFFAPFASSFLLGIIQGFADYCNPAAWAATICTGLLLVTYIKIKPSIVPFANVLNMSMCAVIFVGVFMLALRSVVSGASAYDALSRGASGCAIVVLSLAVFSLVLSIVRRLLLKAAGARLQQDDSTDAARDLEAAAGERTQNEEANAETLLAVLNIQDADLATAVDGAADPLVGKKQKAGGAKAAAKGSRRAMSVSPPKAETNTDDTEDLLLDLDLLDVPLSPAATRTSPSLSFGSPLTSPMGSVAGSMHATSATSGGPLVPGSAAPLFLPPALVRLASGSHAAQATPDSRGGAQLATSDLGSLDLGSFGSAPTAAGSFAAAAAASAARAARADSTPKASATASDSNASAAALFDGEDFFQPLAPMRIVRSPPSPPPPPSRPSPKPAKPDDDLWDSL
jgi:hypothetical protein